MNNVQETNRIAKLPSWVSGALVAAATIATVALVWTLADQNRQLKEALAAVGEGTQQTPGLEPGDLIPSMDIVDLDGNTEDILAPVSNGGVLAIFTTTCRFCIETFPQWSNLHDELSEKGVPFVGVSLHDLQITRNFVLVNPLPWPVRVLPHLADARKLKITGVPLTVLVSESGQVLGSWKGVLTERDVGRIGEEARAVCLNC